MAQQNATDWLGVELAGGRYRVTDKLGEGGMGSVYRAHDNNLDCDVVIKVPHPLMLQQEVFAERFAREIRSLVALSHPHIVKISDVGQHLGIPFAVMQYLGGGNLEDRPPFNSPPVDADCLHDWLGDAAKALDFVHRRGYVHRDVKPGNVLFDSEGNAFLSDFGIAKAFADSGAAPSARALTSTGMVVGTADYMAPEVVLDDQFDGRADQYSLAVTVYELLTARPPFEANTPAGALIAKATKVAPSLASIVGGLPQSLCTAVDRALSRDPAERFESCGSFAAAALSSSAPTSTSAKVSTQQVVAAQPAQDFRIDCPACGRALNMRAEAIGRLLNCPICATALQIMGPGVAVIAGADAVAPATPPAGIAAGALVEAVAVNAPLSGTPLPGAPLPGAPLPRRGEAARRKPAQADKSRWLLITVGGAAVWLMLSLVALAVLLAMIFGQNDPPGPTPPGPTPVPPAPAPFVSDDDHGDDDVGPPRDQFAGRRAGQERYDNALSLVLAWCPPGRFTMGSPPGEADRDDDENQVQVTLTHGFWLGQCEVTQQEWSRIMQTTPWSGESAAGDDESCAANYVNWDDANEFCRRLTEQDRRAGRLPAAWQYALPTEAQWEYACRAGTRTRFWFGDEDEDLMDCGWFNDNAEDVDEKYSHEIALLEPNEWGLHDVHGNVSEWCRDIITSQLPGGNDPEATSGGSDRALRGGNWGESARYCRSANRFSHSQTSRSGIAGFRIACVPADSVKTTPSPAPSTQPAELVAPFSRSQADSAQQQWARHLGKNGPVDTNSLGIRLTLIPAGQFMMGSPDAEDQRDDDELLHRVRITKPFYLGLYEVTQDEFRRVMGSNPSKFSSGSAEGEYRDKAAGHDTSRWAVENVDWNDAVQFCNQLSRIESLPAYYKLSGIQRSGGRITSASVTINGGKGYRLPSEAEWEYACRAGAITAFHFGSASNGRNANVDGSSPYGTTTEGPYLQRTSAAGSYGANNFGLYDMHGNVREWCWDWYDKDYYTQIASQTAVDPTGPASAQYRCIRGGTWYSNPLWCRAADRVWTSANNRDVYFGFRVARDP